MDKDDKEDVKTGYIEKPVVWGIAGMSSILVAMFVAMKKKKSKIKTYDVINLFFPC